ncbi:MAG TPA: hypothetical protein VF580_14475, partial [Thermoanaerobaculia bacterium]
MSTEAPASTVSFAPILEKRFGGRARPDATGRADIPTISVDPGSLHEVALFLRDDPSTRFDLLLDIASVDRSRLPAEQMPR